MDQGLRDWLALALILALLGLIAAWFSRRTYRLGAFAAIVLGAAALVGYGLTVGGHPATYLDALRLGGDEVTRQLFGAVTPARLRGRLVPGGWGWLAMLALTSGLLISFDTLCARRQPPAVRVGDPPQPPPGSAPAGEPPAGPGGRRSVTGELRFRLAAVEVRMPGSMPGGSTLQALATVASGSGGRGRKATAAIMLAVHALEARPRSYEVDAFARSCGPDGKPAAGGDHVLVTVDLRDTRTGRSAATRVLGPCPPEAAAGMAAGFAARQVFRRDVTTPAWVAGSLDGGDLSAYLFARELRPAGRSYRELWECRQRQAQLLAAAVRRSADAGLIQYELASIRDLGDRPLEALLLHLGNRLHHPRFLQARYRLAASLCMLGDPVAFSHWRNAGQPANGADPDWARAGVKAEITRQLSRAGMLRLPARDFRRLGLGGECAAGRAVAGPEPAGRGPDGRALFPSGLARLSPRQRRRAAGARERAVREALVPARGESGHRERSRQVLLLLARREFAACRRRLRASSLLWCALVSRAGRAAALTALRTPPRWWLHPRRRLWAVTVSQEITGVRLCQLEHLEKAAARLAAAQARVRRRLGLDRALDGGRAWDYGKVPWQAVYNAACLYALPAPGGVPADGNARDAVALLRLAISDPACELGRPTEWLSADPDLRPLRGHPAFRELVREQAARDFTPAPDNDVADPWLRELLPASPRVRPQADACPPARPRWLQPRTSRPRQRA